MNHFAFGKFCKEEELYNMIYDICMWTVVELNKQTTETLHVYLTSPHSSDLLQARISS